MSCPFDVRAPPSLAPDARSEWDQLYARAARKYEEHSHVTSIDIANDTIVTHPAPLPRFGPVGSPPSLTMSRDSSWSGETLLRSEEDCSYSPPANVISSDTQPAIGLFTSEIWAPRPSDSLKGGHRRWWSASCELALFESESSTSSGWPSSEDERLVDSQRECAPLVDTEDQIASARIPADRVGQLPTPEDLQRAGLEQLPAAFLSPPSADLAITAPFHTSLPPLPQILAPLLAGYPYKLKGAWVRLFTVPEVPSLQAPPPRLRVCCPLEAMAGTLADVGVLVGEPFEMPVARWRSLGRAEAPTNFRFLEDGDEATYILTVPHSQEDLIDPWISFYGPCFGLRIRIPRNRRRRSPKSRRSQSSDSSKSSSSAQSSKSSKSSKSSQ